MNVGYRLSHVAFVIVSGDRVERGEVVTVSVSLWLSVAVLRWPSHGLVVILDYPSGLVVIFYLSGLVEILDYLSGLVVILDYHSGLVLILDDQFSCGRVVCWIMIGSTCAT